MQTILVAIDFSESTPALIDCTRKLAQAFQSRVYVVHVAAPDPTMVSYEVGPQHERNSRASTLREEHRKLQELSQQLRDAGVEATALLVPGETIDTLLHEAEKLFAEVLVFGAHGHGRLHDLLAGNIASGILKRAQVPLLFVPQPKEST